MNVFIGKIASSIIDLAHQAQAGALTAVRYIASHTPAAMEMGRDATARAIDFSRNHKRLTKTMGIGVTATTASLVALFALQSGPKIPEETIDIPSQPQAVITAAQRQKIRKSLSADYKSIMKQMMGDAYQEPASPATRSQIATSAKQTYAAAGVTPSRSKWNMDALFKYRDVLASGLNILLHLDADTAFNKAVIVESGGRQFDDNGRVIKSHKDATGIAQVLPTTAQLIAERCTGAPLDNHRFYNDAAYNEKLGRCYYREQYQTFGNNTVLAALAYNTGPGNVDKHINRVGDPTKGEINMFDFIRTIPNTENRQYTLYMMKKGGLLETSTLGDDVYDHSYVPTTVNFNASSRQGYSYSYSYRAPRLRFGYNAPAPKGPIVLQAYTDAKALNAYGGKALSLGGYPTNTYEKN